MNANVLLAWILVVFIQGVNVPLAIAQRVMYVNHAAIGNNDGSSWENAYTSLQDALQGVQSGDEVWAAAGVYHPDEGVGVTEGDRSATFTLINGVGIYGGFEGSENTRDERDWIKHETILSGDLLENDSDNLYPDAPTRQDNSYHVVTATDLPEEAILDGLTVTGGNANVFFPVRGGGIISESSLLELHNMIIEKNSSLGGGGGIYATDGELTIESTLLAKNYGALAPSNGNGKGGGLYQIGGRLHMDNVVLWDNWATDGGGIRNQAQESHIHRTWFLSNSAINGGGLYNFHSDPNVTNTFFGGNEAFEGGGGLTNEVSNPQMINVIFSGNNVNGEFMGGGGMLNYDSKPVLINCVFNNNSSALKGGGILNLYKDELELFNCIFGENLAQQGEQVFNDFTDGTITVVSSHSLFVNEIPNEITTEDHSVLGDPLFIDPVGQDGIWGTDDDDYRLQKESPAIDAGNNEALPADISDFDGDGDRLEFIPLDFAENSRVFDGGSGQAIVDLGAFEFDSTPYTVAREQFVPGNDLNAVSVGIYPNPFVSDISLKICSPSNDIISVSLIDILGRLVEKADNINIVAGCFNSVEIRGLDLAKGTYIIRLSGSGIKTARIIFN